MDNNVIDINSLNKRPHSIKARLNILGHLVSPERIVVTFQIEKFLEMSRQRNVKHFTQIIVSLTYYYLSVFQFFQLLPLLYYSLWKVVRWKYSPKLDTDLANINNLLPLELKIFPFNQTVFSVLSCKTIHQKGGI